MMDASEEKEREAPFQFSLSNSSHTTMASINLFLHAPSAKICAERRLQIDEPLTTFRGRLEPITGIPSKDQIISILSTRDDDPDTHASLVAKLGGSDAAEAMTLREYGIAEGMCVRVSRWEGGIERRRWEGWEEVEPDAIQRQFQEVVDILN